MNTLRTFVLTALCVSVVGAVTSRPLLAAHNFASTQENKQSMLNHNATSLASKRPVQASAAAAKPPTVTTALIFDGEIPVGDVTRDEKKGNVGYVWGASAPTPHGDNVPHDHYVAWAQGWCPATLLANNGRCPLGGAPSYPWIKKYHPSWLLWKVNRRGKPTVPARSASNPGPILDFTNPGLQQYWMAHYIKPYLKEGFNGIAWDNPTVYNPYGAAGHFASKKRFVRQYSGNMIDPAWATAQATAMGQLLKKAQAVAPNTKFALNLPVDCLYAPMASFALPLKYVSTIVDEEGYSYWGADTINFVPNTPGTYCANRWLDKTNFYIQEGAAGKTVVLINQEPYKVTPWMTRWSRQARKDIEWAVANYLLVKSSHTYLWFGGSQQYGQPIFEQRELMSNLGSAYGTMQPYQGVYARWFTKGAALVNPSSTISSTIYFKKGKYLDLRGYIVNSARLAPHSGLVLVRRH